ncbi:hypothetical protein H4Q26_002127 [Puccinia striiformis f. sp. tritici PST-130]|nr:hypothetical protein H4Q26_002127 [Puccinia striiformis f. sp. tritici PST-130]
MSQAYSDEQIRKIANSKSKKKLRSIPAQDELEAEVGVQFAARLMSTSHEEETKLAYTFIKESTQMSDTDDSEDDDQRSENVDEEEIMKMDVIVDEKPEPKTGDAVVDLTANTQVADTQLRFGTHRSDHSSRSQPTVQAILTSEETPVVEEPTGDQAKTIDTPAEVTAIEKSEKETEKEIDQPKVVEEKTVNPEEEKDVDEDEDMDMVLGSDNPVPENAASDQKQPSTLAIVKSHLKSKRLDGDVAIKIKSESAMKVVLPQCKNGTHNPNSNHPKSNCFQLHPDQESAYQKRFANKKKAKAANHQSIQDAPDQSGGTAYLCMAKSARDHSPSILLNSCCTNHMFSDRKLFSNYSLYHSKVEVADGKFINVVGAGLCKGHWQGSIDQRIGSHQYSQSPIKVGGICQACINAAATETPAITPQILHPANPLTVSHDEKQMKRQEAIACATHLYSSEVGKPLTWALADAYMELKLEAQTLWQVWWEG